LAIAEMHKAIGEMTAAMTPENEVTGSSRRCIVTRRLAEKPEMVRFVLDGDGIVTPDLKCRLPGRGMWVLAEANVLKKAIAANSFANSAKAPARIPSDLFERVKMLSRQEVLELIGLAKRSGELVAGFEKVQAALRHGKVAILLEASDGAQDGREKLARMTGSGVKICSPLTSGELAPAIGRDHAVHLAVMKSGLAERLMSAIARLNGLETTEMTQTKH